MLELNTRINKKNKTSFINTKSANSYKKLIKKEKKVIRIQKIDEKKNKTMKGLPTSGSIEVKQKNNSIFSKGEIKIAKIHREATRPLKKIKDLTEEEIKNNSCPCCGLPTQIFGKLDNYKMCDSPDEISNCGEGVILYFSFFKFCIIVSFIGTIGISFFDSYISYNYYNELRNFCDILPDDYKKDFEYNRDHYGNNYYDYNHHNKFNDYFNKYYYNLFFNSSKNKCKVYSTNNSTTHKLFNSFFFKISLVNFRNYRKISKQLNNIIEKNKINSTIINLNIVNFICMITIFISYIVYIFFIYNKSNAANYLVYTVGDYSIFLTNLNDIYQIFDENLKYIQNKEIKYNNSNKKLDKKIYEDKLGFEPEENMTKLEAFKKFLQKKILVKPKKNKTDPLQYYDIKRIDLCYELNEIITLQKEIEELDEKIHRMEFDQSIIEKNNKKGFKGDKRIYYSCCLFCETEESLEQIKQEKEEKEKKMNELIESSRKNISEHFCGSAFVTFNTIKEQEDCLSQNQNICGRQTDELKIILKLYLSYFCCCFCCCFCCSCDSGKDSLNYYKRKIIFERAPEPEDIIFENLEGSLKTKIENIFCVTLVSLIIGGISFVINGLLFYLQSSIDKSEDPNGKTLILYVLSFLISIANSIIDFIIGIKLEKIIKRQKSYTLTNFYATYSLVLSLLWFLNSSLLPILLDIFNSKEEHEVLTSNMLMKFLFNSFVEPIMWTINIKFLYKWIKKCIIEQKEQINYNQKELNELYELSPMNVAAKYSYLVKTLLISFIFAPIFPLGFCISFFGFIFGYWLEKFNFSKMYKKPEKLDKQIAKYYIQYFAEIFSSYYLGSYYLILDIDNFEIWNWIFWVFIPIIFFRRCFLIDFFKIKESEIHKKTYDDMYLDFIIDYERANPVTRIEGEMRYLDKLEEKNKINLIEKDKRKRKIKEENQMKLYLRRQRISRIANIKELNNMLNLDGDVQKNEKDIICNIEPIIENDKKEGKIFKIKKLKSKSRKKNEKHVNNETGTSFPSHFFMNKENSTKTAIKYS